MSEETFKELSRLMAVLLRPFEEFSRMSDREISMRAEIYRALESIKWGNPVPDSVWAQLDELDRRLS